MKIELKINDQFPTVLNNIEWETDYFGSPSRLTFTVVKVGNISFGEGAIVELRIDNREIFRGFVFEKSRDKDHHIQVIAYDQLRYFANKHWFQYTNKRADEVLKELCDDFKLHTGSIDNTGHTIKMRDEDNQTVFDIVETALDITYRFTKQDYVLYDDFGKICLRNANKWTVDHLVDASNSENFNYTTSIDKDTYNQIVVLKDSGEKGKKELYVTNNGTAQGHWGILRHVETIQEADNGVEMANVLMDLKCRVTRDLELSGVKGNFDVRAGCKVPVTLNLGDQELVNIYLQCESVTHHITCDKHTMDIKFFDREIREGAK